MDEKRTVSLQDYEGKGPGEVAAQDSAGSGGGERRAGRGAAPALARGPKSRGTANPVTMPPLEMHLRKDQKLATNSFTAWQAASVSAFSRSWSPWADQARSKPSNRLMSKRLTVPSASWSSTEPAT